MLFIKYSLVLFSCVSAVVTQGENAVNDDNEVKLELIPFPNQEEKRTAVPDALSDRETVSSKLSDEFVNLLKGSSYREGNLHDALRTGQESEQTSKNGKDEAVDETSKKKEKSNKILCKIKEVTDPEWKNTVTAVSDATLQLLLKNEKNHSSERKDDEEALCQLLLLYAPWCRFSINLIPHYNAVARLYPDLELLAINAVNLNYWNARFGTVSVPNVLLFHHGKFISKFNSTARDVKSLSIFLQNNTNLSPTVDHSIEPEDYTGELPIAVIEQTDPYVYLSWVVVISALIYGLEIIQKTRKFYLKLFGNQHEEPHPHIN